MALAVERRTRVNERPIYFLASCSLYWRCFDSGPSPPPPTRDWSKRGGGEAHSCTHTVLSAIVTCRFDQNFDHFRRVSSFSSTCETQKVLATRGKKKLVVSFSAFGRKTDDFDCRHFGWTLFVYILQHIFGSHHGKSSAPHQEHKHKTLDS
jgi:hypothetical protein